MRARLHRTFFLSLAMVIATTSLAAADRDRDRGRGRGHGKRPPVVVVRPPVVVVKPPVVVTTALPPAFSVPFCPTVIPYVPPASVPFDKTRLGA